MVTDLRGVTGRDIMDHLIAGERNPKVLAGVTCIRLDATVTFAHSDKELAEANFKGYGLLTELSDVSAAQEAQSSRGRSQGCPEDPDRQAAAALSPT